MKVNIRNTRFYIEKILLILLLGCNTNVFSQPVANFSASPLSGCAPLTVSFIDNSTGNITSWNWNLGNGTISAQQNPVTTFFNPGTYTVTLTVSNANGSNSISKNQYITVYDKPTVNFSASDTVACIPFNVSFTDLSSTSIGSITNWNWDFGDGSSSGIQNPQHIFNVAGNYNVNLTVTNAGGCTNSLTKLAYIKATDPIRIAFGFNQGIKCKPPETISFSNTTSGPGAIRYLWDFGDGTTSTLSIPAHTYLSAGLFSITLIAANNTGCADTLVLKDTLLIKNIQSSILAPDTVCRETNATFANVTSPPPLSSYWFFSDSSFAYGLSATKSWSSPGTYSVKLINNYITCRDSVTKTITVRDIPIVNFSANDSNACNAPLTVNFTDLTPKVVSRKWYFGDGDSSTSANPSHNFLNPGLFNIQLVVTDSIGCRASVSKNRFIKISKPIININTREGGGCINYIFRPLPTVFAPDGVAAYFWDFGNGITSVNANPQVTYTALGNYNIKLVVTSNDGCRDSATIINGVKIGTKPSVNFGVLPSRQCPGVNVLFSDSSIPADRWLWQFGDGDTSHLQNPNHQYSDSGNYTVKLIAWNNGCSDSIAQLQVVNILPGFANFTPVYNCLNKKEVFFKDSSILPQSWFWDFGDGNTSALQNPTHQFANYQNYVVTLTTSNDTCSNKKSVSVNLVNEVPDFRVSKDSFCKSDSTIFYLTGFKKENITRYIWNFGDGTSDTTRLDSLQHQYLNAGTYTVTLSAKDIHDCEETVIKTNMIHVFGPKAGFTINAAGGCFKEPVNFYDTSITANGNNNIANWEWNFGDGQLQQFTAPLPVPVQHVYNATGSYYPFLKITDSLGCSDSIAYPNPITIYKPTASFFAPNANTCINDTVIFRNPSSGNALTYWWSFGDSTFSATAFPLHHYSTNGDYTVKLIVSDTFGCKDSLTRINYIKVRDVLASFSMSDTAATCTPLQVNFTNNSVNATSYAWEFGDGGLSTTTNPSYSYTLPGIYFPKLTARRSTRCTSSMTQKIQITAPVATLTYSPREGCTPLTVSFHISTQNKLSYLWDFNDGSSYLSADSNAVHDYLLPGKFVPKVILKDSGGCVIPLFGKDTIFQHSSIVNFTNSDSVLCDRGIVNFSDATVSGDVVTGYTWHFGDGGNDISRNPSHSYNTPGLYAVKLVVSTLFGCRDSIIKNAAIKVVKKPEAAIMGTSSFCGPSAVQLQGNLINPDTSFINWSWQFFNGNSSVLQNPPAQQYADTGTYPLLLVVTNSSGCTDSVKAQVIIKPLPELKAGNDTVICLNDTAKLYATGAATYQWQPAVFLNCTACASPFATPLNSNLYTVKGTGINGCEKTDSVFITVKQPFRISGLQSQDSVCAGKPIQLNVSGAENYRWIPSSGLSNTTIANPVARPPVSTAYTVVGFDSSNCFKDSATLFIKVNDNPVVNAGPDRMLNVGNTLTLTPTYSDKLINWLWQPANGLNCSDCPNPIATALNDITYTIKVTNNSGCFASDSLFIKVSCDNNNLFLPNAFSPNNDPGNVNEIFYPRGKGIFKINNFKIYDRFGKLVFVNAIFNANDKNAGWNGLYNGKPAPVGNYIYTIEFTCSNKETVNLKGNILLLR